MLSIFTGPHTCVSVRLTYILPRNWIAFCHPFYLGILLHMSYVAWSVCVGHNVWTDGDAICGLTHVGPMNHVLHGVEIPYGNGQFWGLFSLLKRNGNLWCRLCSKRDHSVSNNGITARLLQPTAMLQTDRCHITVSSLKNPPPVMRPFFEILWPLV